MPTNSFFDWATGSRFVRFDTVRAADVNAALDSVTSGFDMLPTPAKLAAGYANYGADTGAADAYVVALSSQLTALATGVEVRFKAGATNTGASTLNVNSLGAKAIVRPSGATLEAGDILTGQIVACTYDATSGKFQLAVSSTGVAPSSYSGTAGTTVDFLAGTTIASAATINLSAATGNRVHVSGTTPITAVTLALGPRTVIFDDALTLTHHATNNNLPGAANITTAAGDRATYESDGTTVYCTSYVRANGTPVLVGAATQTEMEAASSNTAVVTPANVNWHPGAAKAWLKCGVAGDVVASHNITSITDTGAGVVTITIGTDFSSASFIVTATAISGSARICTIGALAAGSAVVNCFSDTGGAADPSVGYMVAFYGDQ